MKLPPTILSRRVLAALALPLLVGLLSGGTGIPARPAQSKDKPKKTESTSANTTQLVEDKGRLRILLDGQQVGTEEFQISPEGAGAKEWTARGTTEIPLPDGSTAHVSGRLKLASDGTPLRYEWSARGQKKASAVVEFQGRTAKIVLQLEGAQPYMQELSFNSPRVVILDNNLYHHYAVLARIYDWNARGAQTFPVLIPQDMTPGSIAVEALGRVNVEGEKPALHALSAAEGSGAEGLELLRVQTADLEVQLFLDASRRLVRLAVPASKAVILRE